MASIKRSTGSNGQSRYYVHWQDENTGSGRRRIFKNVDDAAHFLWNTESERIYRRTAWAIETAKPWPLFKLIYFFLGYQFDKLERNAIKLSTYTKCRYDLLAIHGDILGKNVLELSHYDLAGNISPGALRWIRSAFIHLVEMRVISESPMNKAARPRRKPIIVPAKQIVKKLLNESALRERIACWLGAVCGLRIGEVLALTYQDVSCEWISVHKHITEHGMEEGLKMGVQRRIKMPRGLFELLDPEKFGTDMPIIENQRTGEHIGIKYASQGPLKQLLTQHGIKKYHHLRHFAVSRLADRGVDILKVSRMIGHSDIRTTMNIYGHLFGETIDLNFD